MSEKPIDLAAVEAARAEALEADENRQAKWAEVDRLNQELHDRVEAGESTGNRIIDHVIRRNRGLDMETVDLFRSLEARVASHVGEPVLVIARKVEYSGHSTRGRFNPYIETKIGLGILKKPELNIDESGDWSFPTDSHVIRGGGRNGEKGLQEGPLSTEIGRLGLFGAPLEEELDAPLELEPGTLGVVDDSSPTRLEIAVGNDEIKEKLRRMITFGEEQYQSMLDELMRLPAGEEATEAD